MTIAFCKKVLCGGAAIGLVACATAPAIQDADAGKAYAQRVLAENGCQMTRQAYNQRLIADGFLRPDANAQLAAGGRLGMPDFDALAAASLVELAPDALIGDGVFQTAPADSNLLISNGEGCT